MTERIRTLADEIRLIDVLPNQTHVIPGKLVILIGHSSDNLAPIQIESVSVMTTIRNRQKEITKQQFEIKTAFGQFLLTHILSTNSWSLGSLESSKK